MSVRIITANNLLTCELRNHQIIPITTSAGDILKSDPQWAGYLEQAEINAHAFPIIGVDKLGYLGHFAQETARIVEGRDFTREELDSGARVCIVAEIMALTQGLKLGDTITAQYYDIDPEIPQARRIGSGFGTTEPAAYFFTENTAFVGEPESYTIVGFYRAPMWGSNTDSLYHFTPNTIFVPKAAVTGPMDYGDRAFFRTIVLENGKMQDFMQMASDAGYDGEFYCYDHGYSEIAPTFLAFRQAAIEASLLGSAVYIVIALLYLLLFPVQQRKALKTMESLGAPRLHRLGHVLLSSLGLLLPATVAGLALALAFWERLTQLLMNSVQVTIPLEMDFPGILAVAALQLAVMMLLVAGIGLAISKNKKL